MHPKSLAATMFDLHVAIENCKRNGNDAWFTKHRNNLDTLRLRLPSGSGIDSGTEVFEISTTPERITLACAFHHMNDQGSYDGWTNHKIYVTPSFNGLNVRVTGANRNDIKDYLHEVYHHCLTERVIYNEIDKRWFGEFEGAFSRDNNRAVPEEA